MFAVYVAKPLCHVVHPHPIFVMQDDTKFKQALKIRNPKNRLKRIYDACKSKKVCAGGDDLDVQEQDTDEPVKKRGGCGAQQPNITVDGMKMVAEFKAPKKKTDDQDQLPEPVERKQILSAERVYLYLCSIPSHSVNVLVIMWFLTCLV
jgi:DNA-directed RNA polymerase II subunit RPB1